MAARVAAEEMASGLLEVSFYRHMKLDGDLAGAMAPTDQPLHFTTNGLILAPFFVADPVEEPTPPAVAPEGGQLQGRGRRGPPTQPYHIYFRRREPSIVFGSVDSGVPNGTGPDDLTFLDAVWSEAPFPSHQALLATLERMAGEWAEAGKFTQAQKDAILEAARQAEADLRV